MNPAAIHNFELKFLSVHLFRCTCGAVPSNGPFSSQVFKARPLVDLAAAILSALLINETQWVGIIVRPINYSLKGAVLYVDTGPGLKIEESHFIEMESYIAESNNSVEQLTLSGDRVEFPDWASNLPSVVWIPVHAISETLARGSSSGCECEAIFLVMFL